ncbi:MAG TPA: hypothetical protein VI033_06330 [Candidatus Nitrosopolaris sp.]
MVIDKLIWTCDRCGQGFTRRPSADRHNINLHSGHALVIRTFEYIIGRVNGRFPEPTDPLSFRHKRTSKIQLSYSDVNRTGLTPVVYQNQNTFHYSKVESIANNANVTPYRLNSISQPQYKLAQKQSDPFRGPQSTSKLEKLAEFERLSYKHYSHPDAERAITMVRIKVFNLGDEGFLDVNLEHLREIDKNSRLR